MENYYTYWGKSKKRKDEKHDYHLLVYHCIDVAVIGEILIDDYCERKKHFLSARTLNAAFIRALFVFFLTLHDIGKFSNTFQFLIPVLFKNLQKKTKGGVYKIRHDRLGWIVYQEILKEIIINSIVKTDDNEIPGDVINIFASIVFGHHGKPLMTGNESIREYFDDDDLNALLQFCNYVVSTVPPVVSNYLMEFCKIAKKERKVILRELKKISWDLAAIVVVSDWIASGDMVAYELKKIPFDDYRKSIILKAHDAVNKSGVLASRAAHESGLAHLFPEYANTPTPLQKYCDEISIENKPQLWILEDVTGSGKTEASLILASKMISRGLADGIFIALPTMATSNAMYERMGNVYYRLFDENEKPSLVLSHGSRHLSEKFRKSYSDHIVADVIGDTESDNDANEGRVHCSRWLADSSKKALLADAGVGTIDQILLSVLPVRYQSLRYYGMGRKVLIIDEVHSYDAYMLRILETVLNGHAAAGGSAILLSATLPYTIRKSLVSAYNEGLDNECETENLRKKTVYPLATGIIQGQNPIEKVLKTRREVERTVTVSFIERVGDAIGIIKDTIEKGQCICWIRNTVSDVFHAYDLIIANNEIPAENIDVFHSRYALRDRIGIEKKVLQSFGNRSGYKERKGRLLLATQVVEQSLDLDFDVLISDLAPIDLIIQRAGRLHRHLRDEYGNRVSSIDESKRPSPILYVHIPPEVENPAKTWFSDFFPGASIVYSDHAILWRTKEILKKEHAVVMPQRARFLIESVYGENALAVPEVFHSCEEKAKKKEFQKTDIADFNMLNLAKGYSIESSQIWDEEEKVPPRLGSQLTIYLSKIGKGEIVPLYKGEYEWEMSSLKVRKGLVPFIKYEDQIMQMITNMIKMKHLSYDSQFIFVNDKESTVEDTRILYDSRFGLKVIKE